MVLLYMAGRTQREIGEMFGVTRVRVGQIVNDPRADEIRELAKRRYQEHLLDTMEEELDAAAKLAVKAVRRTVEADISPKHKAKANQDRVALKLLTGRGFLAKERGEGGGLQMSDEQFQRLTGAIEKSDQAKEIDPFEGQVVEAEVIEEGADADSSG